MVYHEVLVLIERDHVRKKFLTPRTPFVEKIERRNLEKSTFQKKKFEKILKVQEFL